MNNTTAKGVAVNSSASWGKWQLGFALFKPVRHFSHHFLITSLRFSSFPMLRLEWRRMANHYGGHPETMKRASEIQKERKSALLDRSQEDHRHQQNAGPGVPPLGTSQVTHVALEQSDRADLFGKRSAPRSYKHMITHPPVAALGKRSADHCTPLKYQRLLRGWSLQDVADELYKRCAADGHPEVGVSLQHIYRWEAGYCKPRPIYRKHLCQLYDLTAEQLGLIILQKEVSHGA
jgi:hypothetical protein